MWLNQKNEVVALLRLTLMLWLVAAHAGKIVEWLGWDWSPKYYASVVSHMCNSSFATRALQGCRSDCARCQ